MDTTEGEEDTLSEPEMPAEIVVEKDYDAVWMQTD